MGMRPVEVFPSRWLEYEPPSNCHDFGIGELLAGLLTTAGVGAETAGTIAPIAIGVGEGAAFGAGEAALTGGDIGKGALLGGATGGAISGFGPLVSEATGLGATASDALVGTAAGGLGAAATGGNVLTGAASGGIGGALAGEFGGAGGGSGSGVGTSVTPASPGGTGGGSAAAASGPAAPSPAGVGGGGPAVDLTSTFGLDPTQVSGSDFLSGTAGQPAIPGKYTSSPITASLADGAGAGAASSKIFGLNPGTVLGGAALGANLLFGNQPSATEKQIGQNAGEDRSQARTDAAYQQSGTLPAGLQAVVDQQFDAAKGAVVNQYAQEGLGQSTQLTDKLNQLKAQKTAEVAQFADSLAKQGISLENLSAGEFGQLLSAETARNAAFTNAISSFARGIAGGGIAAAAA